MSTPGIRGLGFSWRRGALGLACCLLGFMFYGFKRYNLVSITTNYTTRSVNVSVLNDGKLPSLIPLHVLSEKLDLNNKTRRTSEQVRFREMGGKRLPRGVRLYSNVCVESGAIVIYEHGSNKPAHKVRVTGFPKRDTWDLTFRTDSAPVGHRQIDAVAFFVYQKCPGNFHHFIEDEFFGLFSMIRSLERQQSHHQNHVIYHDRVARGSSCEDAVRYQWFLQNININTSIHAHYQAIKPPTCFTAGIFGIHKSPNIYLKSLAIRHVKEAASVKDRVCGSKQNKTVTLLERSERKILNIQTLKVKAESLGWTSQIVNFGKLSVPDQLHAVRCSRVLVGVQGAGLQWAMFMARGATLVEIAWPQKWWMHFYTSRMRAYGIRTKKLSVSPARVHVNWEAYLRHYPRNGAALSQQERQKMEVTRPKRWDSNNLWKWADAEVDPNVFNTILKGAH